MSFEDNIEHLHPKPQNISDAPDIAISIKDLNKIYQIYREPSDRLKQLIWPGKQKFYTEFQALKDINIEIPKGQTVGIVGRNGSGKSTLLQIICNTLQPTTGQVNINGRIAALLELGAGFNPEFTGRENVYLNATILGMSKNEIDARFETIAKFADIGDFIEQPVKTYSSGMFVRLAFATAINTDPDILIIDEALSVGDESFQRKCFARLEQIQERGATVLFVSHSASSILQLCNHAILIDSGELILEGHPKTVMNQYHRFMNLPASDIETARQTIKDLNTALNEDTMSGENNANETDSSKTQLRGLTNETQETANLDKSWYDPNLISKSMTKYVSKGAQIRDMKILNEAQEQVNNLQTGQFYTYEYWADFEQDVTQVGFGMGVLTLEGFSFGGANTYGVEKERITYVKKNTSYHVTFRFKCILRPGTYVFNSGVQGKLHDGMEFIARTMDAMILRVIPREAEISGGPIDFEISITPKLHDLR